MFVLIHRWSGICSLCGYICWSAAHEQPQDAGLLQALELQKAFTGKSYTDTWEHISDNHICQGTKYFSSVTQNKTFSSSCLKCYAFSRPIRPGSRFSQQAANNPRSVGRTMKIRLLACHRKAVNSEVSPHCHVELSPQKRSHEDLHIFCGILAFSPDSVTFCQENVSALNASLTSKTNIYFCISSNKASQVKEEDTFQKQTNKKSEKAKASPFLFLHKV